MEIYAKIKQHISQLESLRILYKKNESEYLTENINLEWVGLVDSHNFYKWLELKRIQKEHYNKQKYAIVLRLEIRAHTYR